MKKRVSVILALLLTGSMMAGCGGSTASSEAPAAETASSVESAASEAASAAESVVVSVSEIEPENSVIISVDMEGFGRIATAQEGEELELDDEYPIQSAMMYVEKGKTYTVAARPDEGYKILRWTENGEEFGSASEYTLTAEENENFVVYFSLANPNENAQISELKTIGDLLDNVADQALRISEETYIYVFELGGRYYRAIAELPEEVSKAYWELDVTDEKYDEKAAELVRPVPIKRIEDLTDAAPSMEEMEALKGKTVAELLEDGWSFYYFNFEDMEFGAYHQIFDYKLVLEGEAPETEDFEVEDLGEMKVVSVEYAGLGNMTELGYQGEVVSE